MTLLIEFIFQTKLFHIIIANTILSSLQMFSFFEEEALTNMV